MPETATAPLEERTNRVPITDDILDIQHFNERIVGAYNHGTTELGLPADPGPLRSSIRPANPGTEEMDPDDRDDFHRTGAGGDRTPPA